MAKQLLCGLTYTHPQTFKQIKSEPRVYCKKHNHYAQPTQIDWGECLKSLKRLVNKKFPMIGNSLTLESEEVTKHTWSQK